MGALALRKPEPKACVWVNGVIEFVGPWPLAKTIEKQKLKISPHVEVHNARHYYGVDYCKKCRCGTIKPYLFNYNGHDYWKCECNQINFVN